MLTVNWSMGFFPWLVKKMTALPVAISCHQLPSLGWGLTKFSSKKGLLLITSGSVRFLCPLPPGNLDPGLGAFFMHVAGVTAAGTSRDSLWLTVAMFEPQSRVEVMS